MSISLDALVRLAYKPDPSCTAYTYMPKVDISTRTVRPYLCHCQLYVTRYLYGLFDQPNHHSIIRVYYAANVQGNSVYSSYFVNPVINAYVVFRQ